MNDNDIQQDIKNLLDKMISSEKNKALDEINSRTEADELTAKKMSPVIIAFQKLAYEIKDVSNIEIDAETGGTNAIIVLGSGDTYLFHAGDDVSNYKICPLSEGGEWIDADSPEEVISYALGVVAKEIGYRKARDKRNKQKKSRDNWYKQKKT